MAWTTPKTWAVGDPGTSSDLNTYVRDNAKFLYGDVAWTAPALQNGWVNVGAPYNLAGYRLAGNWVELRGAIKNGTITSGTLLFTLPAGYRPLNSNVPMGYASASGTWTVIIASTGAVTANAGAIAAGSWLDGMRFSLL